MKQHFLSNLHVIKWGHIGPTKSIIGNNFQGIEDGISQGGITFNSS